MMNEGFNKTTRLVIFIVIAAVSWIAGAMIGQEQAMAILTPQGGLANIITRTRNIEVNLMIDSQSGAVKVFSSEPLLYGQSVLDLLVKLDNKEKLALSYKQDKTTGKIGDFSMNNLVSREGGKEWQVWLNHQLQAKPMNNILLKQKDFVELKYIRLAD